MAFLTEAGKAQLVVRENFLTALNVYSNLCIIHAKRVTLLPSDLNRAVKMYRDEGKMRANVKWTK